MKKHINKIKTSIAMAAVLGTSSVYATGLAGVAGNVGQQLVAFKALALQFAFLGGIILFLLGLFLIYKDTQQQGQGHMKKGLIAIVIGAALLSAPALLDSTQQSLTGTANSAGEMQTY